MIETDIELALISLCDGRISPLIAKPGTETPYICYRKKSESSIDVFDGPIATAYCFQVNVFADDMKQAEAIKNQAYENLKSLHPYNIKGMQRYDKDKALFCATLEFSL